MKWKCFFWTKVSSSLLPWILSVFLSIVHACYVFCSRNSSCCEMKCCEMSFCKKKLAVSVEPWICFMQHFLSTYFPFIEIDKFYKSLTLVCLAITLWRTKQLFGKQIVHPTNPKTNKVSIWKFWQVFNLFQTFCKCSWCRTVFQATSAFLLSILCVTGEPTLFIYL